METKALKKYLEELGFSVSESTVYLAVLGEGLSSAGPIIAATRLHRNVVYTALEHLKAKKLVSERLIRGVKHFSIASPETISREFEKKSAIANVAVREIAKRIPQQAQEITIYQGNDEYRALVQDLLKSLPKKSDQYVLGSGGAGFIRYVMRPIWKSYHEIILEQGVRIHMLAYHSQKKIIETDIEEKKPYNVRYLPDEIATPTGIYIYPAVDTVLQAIYFDETTSVTVIKIRSKALVEGYMNLFENLWRSAD